MRDLELPRLFEAGFNSVLEKHELEKKASLEKRAFIDTMADQLSDKFAEKFAEGLANVSARKAFEMGGKAFSGMLNKKIPRRNLTFISKLMQTDQILKSRPPERIASHYGTMFRVAPSISLDANVVASFLRESTAFETMSTVTIKSLLDLEKAIAETADRKQQAYGKLIGI